MKEILMYHLTNLEWTINQLMQFPKTKELDKSINFLVEQRKDLITMISNAIGVKE